jgi:hypothetical protein
MSECIAQKLQDLNISDHIQSPLLHSNPCKGSLQPACHGTGHGISGHVCCHVLQLLLCILAALEEAKKVAQAQHHANDGD